LGTLGIVKFPQFQSQAPGLNPHSGIRMWIEIGGAAENFCGDLVFLDRVAGMIECLFAKVSKQLAKGFRAVKDMTIHKSLYFLEALLPTRELDSCHGHVTLQVTY
jgi:hypothetical protein